MAPADTLRGPLHGIRVLDLTQFLSGPFGTQILGDLGAEVIKIEAPGGELARTVPPNYVEGDSAYYLSVNRNKKNVCVDLKTPQGVTLVRDLVSKCDVFIENNRPGVTARLGLGEKELRERDPRLVYCSLSGFGQSGPDRDLPAYDLIVQALSGGMSMTGEIGAPPVRAGIPLGDLTAGLYSVIGILSALHERQRTGQGRFIDISMLDSQIAMLCYQGSYYLQSGRVPGPQGRGHDSIPTYRAFTCGDGVSLVVTANTERMWADLCRALEAPDLAGDPRFKDAHARLMHREVLWESLDAHFARAPAATWQDRLRAASIPCGQVNTLDKALSAEQVLHRNMVVEMVSAAGSVVRVPGDPLKLGAVAPSYPAHLGEDTDAVLGGLLGIDPQQLRVLKNQGAISQYEPGASRGTAR